ncbi:hypothetical protein FRB96_001381 [Tulasnella sp. 330]|nr:hypothetical protein FRB96_001381 [Tulasnella sp. 330]KAG8880017.1 hypothetical protein FRB97_001218 [Tulasnella sp. 331]KAG8888984.1 hypothetical protein FRB98_006248 [Tulasnella sp. 332]
MPIYKVHQPLLTLNTTVDVAAQIKDDSLAPSPAIILSPSRPESRLPSDDVSTLLETLIRPGTTRAEVTSRVPAPLAEASVRGADAAGAMATFVPNRYSNAAASSSTTKPPRLATQNTNDNSLIAFPSPPPIKSRAQSDVSLHVSRPTFSPTWTTSLPPTFEVETSSPPTSPVYDRYARQRERSTSSSDRSSATSASFPPPDPYRDITQLRVTSRGNSYLYPGASFSGTQKSGRNNHDVTVTVVDVDFASNFLCGYLKISNLTDDYPELTTYFDAEIIGGARHGFLTQGASYSSTSSSVTEVEDMTHWGRFPAFRSIKHELKRPDLTVSEDVLQKRGVVFMRWKERFLVPDHKVKDINGASFAGFYYVCVEFGSGGKPALASSPIAAKRRLSSVMPGSSYPNAPTSPSCIPSALWSTDGGETLSSVSRSAVSKAINSQKGWATMTGFYYHADSEPYQQLSLNYDAPEPARSSFEFA